MQEKGSLCTLTISTLFFGHVLLKSQTTILVQTLDKIWIENNVPEALSTLFKKRHNKKQIF